VVMSVIHTFGGQAGLRRLARCHPSSACGLARGSRLPAAPSEASFRRLELGQKILTIHLLDAFPWRFASVLFGLKKRSRAGAGG